VRHRLTLHRSASLAVKRMAVRRIFITDAKAQANNLIVNNEDVDNASMYTQPGSWATISIRDDT
jgi:hypothetical protein